MSRAINILNNGWVLRGFYAPIHLYTFLWSFQTPTFSLPVTPIESLSFLGRKVYPDSRKSLTGLDIYHMDKADALTSELFSIRTIVWRFCNKIQQGFVITSISPHFAFALGLHNLTVAVHIFYVERHLLCGENLESLVGGVLLQKKMCFDGWFPEHFDIMFFPKKT